MGPEELKLIIEAFKELGVEAKGAFIWYLILEYVPAFLIGLLWTGIGFFTVYKSMKLILSFQNDARLREAAGVSICWSTSELSRACDVLREHYNKR